MNRSQISWWLWAAGSLLVVFSWFGFVSNTVGWCGFGIGMVGSVLSWGVRPPQSPPPAAPDAPKIVAKGEDPDA